MTDAKKEIIDKAKKELEVLVKKNKDLNREIRVNIKRIKDLKNTIKSIESLGDE